MSVPFSREMLVAGGGIGGLAAALACNQARWRARVFERASEHVEAGAGLQLGPNATRVLQRWGLGDALAAHAFFPEHLEVRQAASHRLLARLPLGSDIARRYAAPYACLHRADLHGMLLQAVQATGETVLHLAADAGPARLDANGVSLITQRSNAGAVRSVESEGDALVIADGLWSRLRDQVVPHDGPPRPTGHHAWRTLINRTALPQSLRSDGVTVWLGEKFHAVAYPVRRGELLNLVVLAEAVPGMHPGDTVEDWNVEAAYVEVAHVLGGACTPLQDLVAAAPHWRRWALHDRPPVPGVHALARGRAVLLGDAAHPMPPYLAQGAAMAIEDAAQLQRVLAMETDDVRVNLARYALNRWERVAMVQRQATQQGRVYHAGGPLRLARDAALRLMGEHLLDKRWLWAEH